MLVLVSSESQKPDSDLALLCLDLQLLHAGPNGRLVQEVFPQIV